MFSHHCLSTITRPYAPGSWATADPISSHIKLVRCALRPPLFNALQFRGSLHIVAVDKIPLPPPTVRLTRCSKEVASRCGGGTSADRARATTYTGSDIVEHHHLEMWRSSGWVDAWLDWVADQDPLVGVVVSARTCDAAWLMPSLFSHNNTGRNHEPFPIFRC